MDYDVDETEGLNLMEFQVNGQGVQWAGVSDSGTVYLQGDIHPLGSQSALFKAYNEQIPYIAVSAVRVLFPADWLAGECLGDMDRQRIIQKACALARNGGSL